jgi:hypothetical protein
VAVELGERGGLCEALDARSTRAGEVVLTESGVGTGWFEGSAALAEYLARVVRLGPLLDAVLAHPLYRAFVSAAPGLRELMVVGKLRDELFLRADSHDHRWDTMVVDAGASGRALEYLRMPAAAADIFGRGRVHREARRIVGALADPSRTAVHVVATPEEMPVVEAIETVERLRGELALPVGALLMNMCHELPPEGVRDLVESLAESERRGLSVVARDLGQVAHRELGWVGIQERSVSEVERGTRLSALRLPLLLRERIAMPELVLLSQWLEEVVA